jgi:hypothetical protein
MGISIAYRGRLADLTRVMDLEDRLVDLALEIGGLAQIWRSHAEGDQVRMVRGVILNLAPGQESTSLLFSPEGWLIGLTDIEDAERGRLTEPPWYFTKTQFGPLEAHVALVEALAALRREFLPDLEVSDEGGYWETRDLAELARRHGRVQEAIDGLADGLQRHGLSREAAEDPDILVRHIERIAAQVHRILGRPAEHPPVAFPDDEASGGVPDPDAAEARWNELFKHNRRQQERLARAFEDQRSRGEDEEQAFANALDDLGLEEPDAEAESFDVPWQEDAADVFAVPEEEGNAAGTPFVADDSRHPLLERAMDLMKHLHGLYHDTDSRFAPAMRTLFQGAGDAMGGLAQALSGHGDDADDLDEYGLRVTQLKRALRGAAFARGALFALRAGVSAKELDELRGTLGQLEKDIFSELGRLRGQHRGGETSSD